MSSASNLPKPQGDWALFLDVDGTLVEIAETPDAVKPDKRLPALLEEISDFLGGAVALISGRPLDTLDIFFAPAKLPAAGLHGLEYRDAHGATHRPAESPAVRAVAESARNFARTRDGLLVEDKGATVALHYRQNPTLEADVLAFADAAVAESSGISVQRGKMVAEIRPEGSDKGSIIRAFMAKPPFSGRVPVFIGDDITDEAGFAAVNELGGHSIRVGASPRTLARHHIESVAALLEWLSLWTEPVDGLIGGCPSPSR
jgi:trehalose 6-phosphate phosphatase